MDLSIGEFQQVGDTVKQCAADDATVVVGTVIDPDMVDEMRVTVVATGLGEDRPVAAPQPEVEAVSTFVLEIGAAQPRHLGVGEAEPFGRCADRQIELGGPEVVLGRHQTGDPPQEPGVDTRHRPNTLDAPTAAQGFRQHRRSVLLPCQQPAHDEEGRQQEAEAEQGEPQPQAPRQLRQPQPLQPLAQG